MDQQVQTDALRNVMQAVLQGDIEGARQTTKSAIASGLDAQTILNDALTPSMSVVGDEYESGERYVPEMLVSAEAMKSALGELRPLLAQEGVQPRGVIVIGTVEGDLHDIGKDLVAMMLEGAGFAVINLGIDVPAGDFVQAVSDHKPDILAVSALLTTTMTRIPGVILALQEAGLRDSVKIMIGGAPVTADYASEVGADGYAPDAASAARNALGLL